MKEENLYFAHATAVIDEGCQIGKGTNIWHFSHIMTGCKIGDECVLGQNVFVASKVVLGNRVRVQNNVSLYSGLYCEDEVFLGPSVVFTNVKLPRSSYLVAEEAYVPTKVCMGATVGANATIRCGVQIGRYAMIGAGSVVLNDVNAYEMVVGNPAKFISWISEMGNRLVFDDHDLAICESSGTKYKLNKLDNCVVKID